MATLSFQVIDPVSTGSFTTDTYTQAGTLRGTAPADTATTDAGSPYTVPAFSSQVSMTMVKKSGRYRSWATLSDQLANAKAALNNQYANHVNNAAQTANTADSQQASANAAQATVDATERTAGETQEFIDQETINPDETNQFFEDIAGAYNPGESRGDFYDRSVADQQTSLDYYQSQTGFDAGNLDATVQGQVQIRDDILNQTVAISSQNVANALTLLGAMGIDTSTMEAVTNPDGTVSYTTPEGQDLSSVISALGTSLGQKIDSAGAANLAALGYGGAGQDDLFTDIGRIQSTLGTGLDFSSVTDAVSSGFTDQQSYLSGQFGELAGDISGVGGQVTDVQATVDAVETAVGELDTRQLDMVTKLDNLGVDTDSIIAAVGAVQDTVDPLGGQVTDLGQSTAQAVSGLGGDVAGLFGGQDSTSQVVDAVSTRLSSDLGVGDSSLSSIASSIATVGEAQTDDQKALVAQIGQIQSGVTDMDTAIKTNIDEEFKNLMTVFDSDGQLITDFTNAAGEEVKAQLNDDGTLVVSTLTQLGTDVGNIDLSSLDTMKNSIDAAAGSFDTAEGALGSFTSFETKSSNDRKAVLDAIKADSSALDALINTSIPQTISTGLGDYKLEVGANDELLITSLAAAVGFDQSDVASATATAVGFNQANVASAAASAVGFNQSNLVSALDTAVAYDSAALVSAIGFDPTKLSTAASDATKAAGLAKTSKDYSVWGFERVKTIQNSVLPQLVGDEAAITDLINGQTTTLGGDVAALNAQNELLLTSADGVETNLGLLDTSSIESAVNGLNLLTAADVTNAVDLSDLSTLDGQDIRSSVNTSLNANTAVANIKTVVDNIKSGALNSNDLATLGELDASVITNLVDKVDQKVAGSINKEDLISRIQNKMLTTTDLDNLELLDSQDITDAVDLSGLSTLDAADVTSAVGYSPSNLLAKISLLQPEVLDTDDLAALSTLTVADLPTAGSIADAVSYDPVDLLAKIASGRPATLTTDDLTALSTLTVADLPVGPSTSQIAGAVKFDLNKLETNLANGALDVDDLSALSTLTVEDLPTAGDIAGQVNYNPEDLLAKIKLGQPEVLTQDDLSVLSTLTVDDLPIAPTAAEVASAVDYNPTELTSDFTTAIGNSQQALSDLQAGQTATIKGEIGTYQAAVDAEGNLLVSAFNNLDGSIIALDTSVGNIDVSSLDTILSGVQAIPTTALSAQQVTDAVAYNAQDLLDSIANDALTDADLANLSTLTLDDIPAAGDIAGAVNYDPDALMTRIAAGKADDLTADDLTALSTLTVSDLPVAPTAASVAGAVKVDLDSLQTNLASGALTVDDLSALSRLTVADLPTTDEISGAVNYDPTDLLDKISLLQPEVLTQDDLDVLSTLTTDDLSGLATQDLLGRTFATATQANAAVQISLGPINGISGNIDTLLSAADADATANGLRDNAIADSRQDVLTALSQDEGAMRALFSQQTVDIEGELGAYNVRIDSETGSIVASQLSTQTSNLSGMIDTATGTLLEDSATGLTALEQDILDSKTDLYTTLNSAFTAEGDLITSAIDANGDDITRVLDDQGTLTETVTDMNGIVQNEVVTNLGSILDETGRISTTALEIAADTNAESIFSTVQDVFDDQGLLKSEEYDRFNNLIVREFDENNDILERYYNADGTLSGEKILRLEEILSSLFPDAPLAEAGELTGADQRFLQGFRTQGLMSGV